MSDIPIIVVSLIFSAFFSGMEIAYVSSNKISIEIEKKKTGFISSIIKTYQPFVYKRSFTNDGHLPRRRSIDFGFVFISGPLWL